VLTESGTYQCLLQDVKEVSELIYGGYRSHLISQPVFRNINRWKPVWSVTTLSQWSENCLRELLANSPLEREMMPIHYRLQHLQEESKRCSDRLTAAHLMLDPLAKLLEELCSSSNVTAHYGYVVAVLESAIYEEAPLTLVVDRFDAFLKELEDKAPVDLMDPAVSAVAELDLLVALSS
jgi:hypothetical protein